MLIIGPYEEKQIDLKQKPVISVARKILDFNKFKEIGMIIIEINIDDVFSESLKNIGVDSKTSIYVVNGKGTSYSATLKTASLKSRLTRLF